MANSTETVPMEILARTIKIAIKPKIANLF